MQLFSVRAGVLKMDVSSEGSMIRAGTNVAVEVVADNFKNISVVVTSLNAEVRLPFYETDILNLIS